MEIRFLVLSRLRDCPYSWAAPLPSIASFKASSDYRPVSHFSRTDVDLLSFFLALQDPLAMTLGHGKSVKISLFPIPYLLGSLCHTCEPPGSGAEKVDTY